MAKEKQLKITLVKSMICRNKEQRKIVEALGLKKLHQSVILKDCPAVRGSIQKIGFMLDVEEI
ncbi:MAG: 50S ribosomal protein L30 [Eubacteriaceae bacterium]|nr:50S ribosomal protein L30 [Eubacteriaceae bacterium]MBQ1466068.1 50S ribosomal protein L30 [Eubacteriaceae bacterium]MCR4894532.1 50S ribosomal protein L30 [Eubacteriales bacterium]